MRNIYKKIIEQAGDVFDKTSVEEVRGPHHFFVSVTPDDSECVMVTHSTGANRNGRVPSNGVVEWYVKSNYAVGDKKLIFVDASQLFEDPVLRGGGCIDVSKTYKVKEKKVVTKATRDALVAMYQAMHASTLRGQYWDNGMKNVYNKECYSIFLDSRWHDLKRIKGFIDATVNKDGIVVSIENYRYADDARYDIENEIATPHYSVYKASDARSKGPMYFLISK